MSTTHGTTIAAAGLLAALFALPADDLRAADEGPNDALIQMIADLISDADRDMRALGLQQVREEAPGEAATKKFAELLPKLPPEAQAGLLEALGDRGDPAALPAVLQSLESDQESVRSSALGALGSLGSDEQVALLAEKAASGSEEEKAAARKSLVRLKGEGVNAAIESAMDEGSPAFRVALLDVLAARNAKASLPVVLKSAEDSEPAIRLAALRALRFLADEKNTAAVVGLVKQASDDAERRTAKLALLTLCSRGREACAGAIIDGLADADAASQIALIQALARAGGDQALETLVECVNDKDEAVRNEAVRMLSRWPTAAAAAHLKKLAEGDNLRHQVLAIRGLVRLASAEEDKPADVEALAEAMRLATRLEEKRLVLGMLGGVPTTDSLAVAAPALDDPQSAEEASLAVVMIAEQMDPDDQGKVRSDLEKVLQVTNNGSIRERAQKILKKS